MPDRENDSVNGNLVNENIYLSKILLFTKNAHQIAEQLKDYSESTVSTNCINTIGMYPLISRIETPLGILCMSIWIISDDHRFEQFRMAYYSGSSHSIILKTNDEDNENLSELFVITPQGVPTTILTTDGVDCETVEQTSNISNHTSRRRVYYKSIRDLTQLVWDKHGQLDQKTDPSLSHLVDCLAYLCWYLYPLMKKGNATVRQY